MAKYIELEQIMTVRYCRLLLIKVPDGVEPEGLLRSRTSGAILTHDDRNKWEPLDEDIESEIAEEHDDCDMDHECNVIFDDTEATEIKADIACHGRCGNG